MLHLAPKYVPTVSSRLPNIIVVRLARLEYLSGLWIDLHGYLTCLRCFQGYPCHLKAEINKSPCPTRSLQLEMRQNFLAGRDDEAFEPRLRLR